MKRAPQRPRVAILGCGHVGRALANELLHPDHRAFREPLLVWSRSARSLALLDQSLRPQARRRLRVLATPAEALAADVVLLCVADAALVPLARELAWSEAVEGRPVVLITNGYLPLTALALLRRRGCAVGRLHPLAPIPSGLEGLNLVMGRFAVEGDARAMRAARALVAGIDGALLHLKPGRAQTYHAGASLLSGGLVVLFHLAEQVMGGAVRSRVALHDALEEFADTTLWSTWCLGPKAALTGALARGSEALVRGHLAVLRKEPRALALYRELGTTMLDLARERGSIDARTAQRLEARLRGKVRRRARRPG